MYVCVHHICVCVCVHHHVCMHVSICVYGCCTAYTHALRQLLAVLRLE